LSADFDLLTQQLPLILKSVEADAWIARYNFFVLMKSLLTNYSQQVFLMFSKVLLESLLMVEDEVMIIVCEIIEQLLPHYLSQPDYNKSLSLLLSNL
jgi:hypothetical protein